MMLIEVLDVFAADDVDFTVPVGVKRVELCILLPLPFSQIRKISEYLFHIFR